MRRPVVVLTMGRSGSSMVAGLLALHGFWTGCCRPGDRHNPRGYFENERLNGATGRLYRGSIYRDLAPMRPRRLWPRYVAAVLAREGYRGGPWLVKTNAFAWPLWEPLDPIWVLVRRDIESTAVSARRHDPDACELDRWREIVAAHHSEMDLVRDRFDGFDVHSPRLVAGYFADLVTVLDACGIALDVPAATRFVEPAFWHGAT